MRRLSALRMQACITPIPVTIQTLLKDREVERKPFLKPDRKAGRKPGQKAKGKMILRIVWKVEGKTILKPDRKAEGKPALKPDQKMEHPERRRAVGTIPLPDTRAGTFWSVLSV